MRIALQCAVPARGLPPAARLRAWVRAALPPRRRAAIALRIVGVAEGRRLNRDYRGRDRPTNVLSFAYGAAPLAGDLVLCQPVIAREARAQGKTLGAHYAHLVVHGVLHLRGYAHARRRDAERMERTERAILRRLGFADPYVARRAPPAPSR